MTGPGRTVVSGRVKACQVRKPPANESALQEKMLIQLEPEQGLNIGKLFAKTYVP
jgi:hypothetical protein